MKNLKPAAALLLSLCFALSLCSACGKKETQAGEQNAPAESLSETETEPPADGTARTEAPDAEPAYSHFSWGTLGLCVPEGLDASGGLLPDHDVVTELRVTDPNDAGRFFAVCDLTLEELEQELASVKAAHTADGLRDVRITADSEPWGEKVWEGVAYETEDGRTVWWLYHSVNGYMFYQATVCGFDPESGEGQLMLSSVFFTGK